MKKIMLSLGLMLGALTLTNCSNEIDENINTNTDGVAFELTTAIDADRTVANDFKTTWAADDAINLFHAVAGATTYANNGAFAIAEEDLANGRFTGTLKEELTAEAYDWYAFYPYSSDYTTPAGTRYYKLWQQTQTVAANSTAHVVGLNGPLYGVAENVAVGEPVKVQMHQLGSLLRVKVGNESGDDFVIQSINVAAANTYITGSFYVGFNKDGVSRCEMSGASYAYKDVTLSIADEYTIADGDDAGDHCFYAAVAPFTAPEGGETLTITIVTDKGTYETTKAIPAGAEFASGVVNSLVITVEGVAEIIKEFPYTETFADNLGDFTIDDVAVGSLSTIWNYDTYGYMKGSGYKAGAATEGWLISPYVDLTGAAKPVLRFDHAGNFFGSQTNMKNAVSVYVREADGEWAALTIPVYPNGTSWTFVNSDDIALSAYVGKTVQFGFKYTSPASGSIGTWEIKNVEICEAPFSMSATAPAELPNTAGTGSFDLTVKNAEGYTFTVALKDDSQTWISNIAVASNTVTFDVAANTGNARSAAIVVTATNGTNTKTIEVAISQAASASAVQPVTETLNMPTIFSNTKTELTDGTTYNWGGFNVTFTKLNSSTTNYSGGTSGQLRWYKSDILKFAHKDGYKITKIVFTAVSGYVNKPTADSGSVSVSGTTITWTGDAAAVTLTASSGQIRFTQIAITYIPEGDGSGDEPETSEPVQLATPSVTATANGTTVNVSWGAIANASSYDVTVGDEKKNVTGTSAEFVGLSAGTYEVSVIAKGDGTNYTDSAKGTKSVTVVEQQQGDDSTAEVYTLEGKNVTNASAYTTSEQSFTATDGSVWKILGYFKNTTDILQHGAKSNNYILTPACTNDIGTITLTCSGSYYIALWDPSTNKLIPNMVKQNTTSGSAGNGTLTFTLPAGYKQVKIISTRTAAGTGITTSNAATYIKKIVVTSK
ncbi:MAG: hypothetical protein J6K78_04275 [Tidjanibacter sp.]|nr:hypothetical protein [Tidjanibacter sp.]